KVHVTAVQPGRHTMEALVTCAENNRARDRVAVVVVAAGLELSVTGPSRCLVQEPVEFTFVAFNPGTGPAAHVVIAGTLPPELDLLAVGSGGVLDPATRVLTWVLDELAPGQRQTMSARLVVRDPGTVVWQVKAGADRGLETTATATLMA